MKRFIVIPFVIVFILLLIVSYLIKDTVSQLLIIPSIEFLQSVNQNQVLTWFAFLMVILTYSGYKIFSISRNIPVETLFERKRKHSADNRNGRLKIVTELIERSRTGHYSKKRLSRYLSELLIDILAFRDRTTPDRLLRQLHEGSLDIPDQMKPYLTAALINDSYNGTQHHRWMFWKKEPPSPFDLDPEILVTFMENQLKGKI